MKIGLLSKYARTYKTQHFNCTVRSASTASDERQFVRYAAQYDKTLI